MNKILLIDSISHICLKPEQLNEAKNEAAEKGLSGFLLKDIVLQEKNKKNRNGRVYPAEILEREVSKYKTELIDQKCAYGEIDHPDTPIVRIQKTSHMITDAWWEGDTLKGNINIFDNFNGNMATSILKAGGRLGISSRSLGSVERIQNEGEEYDKVNDDLELLAWDIISNPSVLKASFMLHEGLEKNSQVLENFKRINESIQYILEI